MLKKVFLIVVLTLVLVGLGHLYAYRHGGGGWLFSSDYMISYGFPFGSFNCYDKQFSPYGPEGCSVNVTSLIINIVVALLAVLFFLGLVGIGKRIYKLIKRTKHSKR